MAELPAHRTVTRPVEITFKVRVVECVSCLIQAPNPKMPLAPHAVQCALQGQELWPDLQGWGALELCGEKAAANTAGRLYICPKCMPNLKGETDHG
jgi:hypothetical protein